MSLLEENFRKRGYAFFEVDSTEEAVDFLLDKLKGKSVAFGGSVTLEQLGIYERLQTEASCIWHWKTPGCFTEAASAQVYLTSANAVTRDGEILNMDGSGNRVASTLFGHEEVLFVVGQNKLTDGLSAAVDRIRNVAAPRNARRLGRNTPCVLDGICHDCLSPECICSALCILRRKPSSCAVTVLLVRQDLGY